MTPVKDSKNEQPTQGGSTFLLPQESREKVVCETAYKIVLMSGGLFRKFQDLDVIR